MEHQETQPTESEQALPMTARRERTRRSGEQVVYTVLNRDGQEFVGLVQVGSLDLPTLDENN